MNDSNTRVGEGSSGSGSSLKDTVREKAADLASGAKEQVRSQFETRKGTATNELGSLAGALRRAGTELQSEQQGGMAARVLTNVADRIEGFSTSFESKDLDGVVNDVERFARRNPAAFLGTAIAAGFLVSRFLKSSGQRRGYSAGGVDEELYSSRYDRAPVGGGTYASDYASGGNLGTPGIASATDFGTSGSTTGLGVVTSASDLEPRRTGTTGTMGTTGTTGGGSKSGVS